MNMKKTIAAVAAATVAVSAMATTVNAATVAVSAPYKYSLVHHVDVAAENEVTLYATITATASQLDTVTLNNIPLTWNVEKAQMIATMQGDNAAVGTAKWSVKNDAEDYKGGALTNRGVITMRGEFNKLSDTASAISVAFVVKVPGNVKMADINAVIGNAGNENITVTSTGANDASYSIVAARGFTEGSADPIRYPMMTDRFGILTPNQGIVQWNAFQPGINANRNRIDLFTYLDNVRINKDGGRYRNVRAVVNDAIANYDQVIFKFNTALEKVDVNTGAYDKDGDDFYLGFGKNVYPGYYDPEATNWVGYNWTPYEIFGGALIVNELYTMSLSDTKMFNYAQTSISFDWDDVSAVMNDWTNANDYAKYVHSMQLVTSVEWYWDSFELELLAGDSVESGAGDAASDEELGEDEEEEEEEGEEEEEEEEPEVASNPQTGNSPIALAVVPVALAAAAIVAKKRS